jgi:integrase/recombinase XerD
VGQRNRALLETLYSTGMRRSEALHLELSDLDRARGVVLIRQGKGRQDRYAPIGPRALAWIDTYLRGARPQLVQDPAQRLLFVTAHGKPLHPNNVSLLVRRYLQQAGIAKQGACHLFRHTAASLMLDRGADIRHLQEILGHASLATTQIYTHVSIGKLCEVHARTHPGRGEPRAAAAEPADLRTALASRWARLRQLLTRWRQFVAQWRQFVAQWRQFVARLRQFAARLLPRPVPPPADAPAPAAPDPSEP